MEISTRRRCIRPHPRRIRPTPYPLRSYSWKVSNGGILDRTPSSMALERRDWEDATCSVCMEFPHNAVLLLCSSHDKGCRPYMCGTSYRHSNCLDQFKKAYTKSHELDSPAMGEHPNPSEPIELAACPLCRGQVKGWTVVQPARNYLNQKKRSCMQDNCSFTGTYRELQKHVRSEHPCAKPREVDPTLQQKWSRLEHEREREDVISTIRSSMPRSVVFGDYVIEMGNSDGEDSEEEEVMGGDGSGRGISRSILYFFLREGARLMRFHREPNGGLPAIMAGREEDEDEDDVMPFIVSNGGSADIDPSVMTAYSSGGDEDFGALGTDHGRRRRRRRRSRGRSAIGLS